MARSGKKRKANAVEGVKKRKANAVEGAEHRIYRIPNGETGDDEVFVPASDDAPGRLIDSFVHRYMRTVGFKKSDEEEKEVKDNELMREAHKSPAKLLTRSIML